MVSYGDNTHGVWCKSLAWSCHPETTQSHRWKNSLLSRLSLSKFRFKPVDPVFQTGRLKIIAIWPLTLDVRVLKQWPSHTLSFHVDECWPLSCVFLLFTEACLPGWVFIISTSVKSVKFKIFYLLIALRAIICVNSKYLLRYQIAPWAQSGWSSTWGPSGQGLAALIPFPQAQAGQPGITSIGMGTGWGQAMGPQTQQCLWWGRARQWWAGDQPYSGVDGTGSDGPRGLTWDPGPWAGYREVVGDMGRYSESCECPQGLHNPFSKPLLS